jgi:hypothetical protein
MKAGVVLKPVWVVVKDYLRIRFRKLKAEDLDRWGEEDTRLKG